MQISLKQRSVGVTGDQCRRSVSTRPTRPIMSPAFRLPDKPSGQQNGRKYPHDNKKMTPFCLPNYYIHTSYVGATNLVARFPAMYRWNSLSPVPDKPSGQQDGRKYPSLSNENDAILPTKLQHTHKLCRGDLSGRPLSGYRWLDNRIEKTTERLFTITGQALYGRATCCVGGQCLRALRDLSGRPPKRR